LRLRLLAKITCGPAPAAHCSSKPVHRRLSCLHLA